MSDVTLFSLIVVFGFAAVLGYNVRFLREKSIGHFTLLQILYLVVIPGFLWVFGYSYLQSILRRSLNSELVLPDSFLINMTLLSMLFSYGGIAIHAITKMLAHTHLRHEQTEAAQLNRYFHQKFSHNLVFAGGVMIVAGFSLLELNHTPSTRPEGLILSVTTGVILGLSFLQGMYFYTRSKDQYTGRWADLKAVFFVVWLMGILILYGVRKVNPTISDYQFLIPAILSFSGIAFLNVVLAFRRLKNGVILPYFRWRRLVRLVKGREE